ncbi:MAG: J domain-containing protein [Planctomycetia bacterium]|nr:J domain-containing protein [Planctomycetia bacterium]
MAEDYYKTLGVSKTASADEIQKAYLKLARKYHPDMNPEDPEGAKKKFQTIQSAFDVLKDPEKRKQYDQFGPAYEQMGNPGAGGNPFGQGGFRWSSNGGQGGNPFGGGSPFGAGGGGGGINLDDILGMFGAGGGQGGNPFGEGSPFGASSSGRRRRASSAGPVKGENYHVAVDIPFQTAVRGGKVPISLDKGGKIESVDVNIPAGIESGKKIRLRGLGGPGTAGGPAGDLLLEVNVLPHDYYTRRGDNLYVRVPITLKEAALGGKVDVPTPSGTVTVTVPPGTTSGTKLRLKGRGTPEQTKNGLVTRPAGDLYIEFEVQLPKSWSKTDQELIARLDTDVSPSVRSGLHF